MSADKQKSLEAMRTYARDLERERGDNDLPEEIKSKTAKKQQPVTETSEEKKDSKSKPGPTITAVPKKKEVKPVETPELPKVKKEEKKPKKKVIKSPEPKHIPAFHELQKVVETNIKDESAKKETPKAKPVKGIEPTKKVGGGTVITDNKKDKKPLFAQMAKSFKEWVEGIKKALKPKPKNTYEVSQTNRRKGVVQKATSKSGAIFSADSDTLKEQIKARQRAEKHVQDDDDLSWSPYTEPGYPLLEGDEVESVDPRVTKVSVTKKTHAQPKPVIKTTDKIPELHEKKEEATLEALVEETGGEIPTEPIEETPPQKEDFVPEEEVQEVVEPEDVETEVSELEEESEIEVPGQRLMERIRDISLKDTNTLAMLLVGIALAIVIFGIVLFRIFDVNDNNATEPPVVPERAIYSGATLDTIMIKSRSFNEVLVQTNSALIEVNSGTSEYKYVQGTGEVLPSDILMHLIQTNPSDGFANAVTSVRFIETNNESRAIILTTPDETTARGGMLNWEPTLLSDLGILLKTPNVPPNAGEFTDIQLGSLDVRALMFDGNPLLVYSVVNGSDVIIATNMETLSPFTGN